MRKFFTIILAVILFINPVYAEDDDSTPYMPYPEQPQQESKPQTKTTKKKAPAKKQVKKKVTKKAAPKKVVKKSPPKLSSLQKGIELLQQDRLEQAKQYLLKAIQENRNDPNAWYWYGVWHEKTGGFYQAQYFYSKAITIDPAFEPLSRVVYYPNDDEKTPLWDPKRPARVYPVETSSRGVTTVPPNVHTFPSAPDDPELPKVPVYTPPEPGAAPLDGDPWAPGIYVPPSREEIQTDGELTPQYIPPKVQSVNAENYNYENYETVEHLEFVSEPEPENDRDRIIRADIPLYNPPKPGEKIAQAPKAKTETKTEPQKKSVQQTQNKRVQTTIPTSRVVRQSDKKQTKSTTTKAAPAKPQTKKSQPKTQTQKRQQTVSQDVKPKTPARPSQPQTRRSQPERPERREQPQQPRVQNVPETRQQEQQETLRRQSEYLPPVGQFPSDPGTIPDAQMLPPAGQGN